MRNGKVIGLLRTPTTSSAVGMWTMEEQSLYRRAGAWPTLDQNFSSVSLQLLGETEADTSLNGFAITKNGNATTSTAQAKYGSRSWYFDGNGDFVSLATNSAFDFGTGDLTVEAWVYIAGNSSQNGVSARDATIYSQSTDAAAVFDFFIGGSSTTTGTGLCFFVNGSVTTASTTVTQSQWNHCAISKSGSSVRMFLNGAQVGTTYTNTSSFGNSTAPIRIGGRSFNSNFYNYLNGYIDELRVTKGVARYTSNFTPPGTFA